MARARSCSPFSASRKPIRSTSSIASRRCCRTSRTHLPRGPSLACPQRPLRLDPRRGDDVQFTLLLTIALVIMVIFLFLRRVTATIIPALAVPISLIATLGACTCSISASTTFRCSALTLSVGLVVDDAIVMLENIYPPHGGGGSRRRSRPLSRAAARSASPSSRSRVSLVAVFIPVLLMGGDRWPDFQRVRPCRDDGASLASAFVSLTLTPMLCPKMLPANQARRAENRRSPIFERGFEAVTRRYRRALAASLRHQPLIMLVFLATLLGTAWLLHHAERFFPAGGYRPAFGFNRSAPGYFVRRHGRSAAAADDVFRNSPYVTNVASIVGSSGQAQASMPAVCSSS